MAQDARDTIPPDPLIDEIRAIRKAISDKFDNDVGRLCEHLQEAEKKHPDRLVKSRAKRAQQSK